MKWLLGIIVVVLLAGGAWYYSQKGIQQQATGPSTAAGINGSPNQGNLGQPDNGQVQQPNSTASANLALGINNTGSAHLVGSNGMTLYTYDKDTGSTSTCYQQCATNWPPYIVSASDDLTHLMAGITGLVSTTKRTDGSLQVTYNGHPLYFYIGDKVNSDMTGDGKGGVWHIVKP